MEKETDVRCCICKKVKPVSYFYESGLKRGDYRCIPCRSEKRKENIKNIRYLLNILYLRHVHNRRKSPVMYTIEEFHKWALKSKEFMDIYRIWAQEGYKDDQKPSVIRIKSKEDYTLNNLRVIESHRVRDHQSDPRERMVNQYTLDDKYIATYPNAKIASEIIGLNNYTGISSNCRGERKSAYGYHWTFA